MSTTSSNSTGGPATPSGAPRPGQGAASGLDPAGGAAESDLIVRLKAGEDAAFEELVRLHGPRMLAVARRYLPSEADAEDALQDALLSAFRAIGTFAAESRLSTWLHRITANAALMRIRSRRRRPETLVDAGEFEFVAEGAGRVEWTFTATEALARQELRDGVLACLDRLSEDFRIVVRFRDIEGMDLGEIGRVLSIPLSTVKSRLRRGRAAVRNSIEAQLGAVQR